jgi:hypothetical protein
MPNYRLTIRNACGASNELSIFARAGRGPTGNPLMRHDLGLRKRKVERGRVWCPPLRLYFPRIFRISEKTAKRPRDASAPALHHISYTLDPSAMAAIGSFVVEEIDRLDGDAPHSLIVRHHWSRSLASSYLEGVEDMAPHENAGVFELDDAVFTLAERPTGAGWPAPMIIYVAEIYHSQSELDAEHFEVVVGPDGRAEPRELLGG